MSKTIGILGIAGSLRRESYNRAALRAATRLGPAGNLTHDATKDFIRQLIQNPMDWSRRIGQPRGDVK